MSVRWRALWEASPQRSPFSTLEYVRAAAAAAHLRVEVVLVEDGSAGAAVTWRRRGLYREVIVPPFTPFSGLLLNAPLSESAVHGRRTALEPILDDLSDRFDAVRLHIHPSVTDVRPAQLLGWSAEPLYTYRIDTADPSAWSDSAARNFRSARGEYEIESGSSAASEAVRLALASYARHGRPAPMTAERLHELARDVMDAGLATAYAARHREDNNVHAAVIVASDGKTAYYWIAGSEPGPGMTVLIGDVLKRLFDGGIRCFDFMGANTPGIAEFKRRFGSELVPYFSLDECGRADLKLLRFFRKMMG